MDVARKSRSTSRFQVRTRSSSRLGRARSELVGLGETEGALFESRAELPCDLLRQSLSPVQALLMQKKANCPPDDFSDSRPSRPAGTSSGCNSAGASDRRRSTNRHHDRASSRPGRRGRRRGGSSHRPEARTGNGCHLLRPRLSRRPRQHKQRSAVALGSFVFELWRCAAIIRSRMNLALASTPS